MQQIFVDANQVFDNRVEVVGQDAKHLARVVRIRVGEKIRVSIHGGKNYFANVSVVEKDRVVAEIIEESGDTEASNHIYLFQGLPKGSKFETIIEKTVELGVYEIIPVEMKNCVVKLDDKKKESKIRRYQAVAESAAKQSKRSIIPHVHDVMTYDEALRYAEEISEVKLLPYENKDGMLATKRALDKIKPDTSVSIFIGPEGGFSKDEIEKSKDMDIISLGKRILRTETAAIVSVAMLMLHNEFNE
ncbi:MAG: 16S rRNA (uracil(1498)-N(3))-methyltransferase [Lachnospiraceae bacterium]|nr:16S rRNA (uracil(1498)-N(3))-methyltransferase [Lachnospiraceae bacterium]